MLSSAVMLAINPGQWFARKFSEALGAEKTLVQKSGYFARSARSNDKDLKLIKDSAKLATVSALNQDSGVVGKDMKKDSELVLIDFKRIRGGKPFDFSKKDFNDMLVEIGQV